VAIPQLIKPPKLEIGSVQAKSLIFHETSRVLVVLGKGGGQYKEPIHGE
jgi:hypothetical protein